MRTEKEIRLAFIKRLEGYDSATIQHLLAIETHEEIKELLNLPMAPLLREQMEKFAK